MNNELQQIIQKLYNITEEVTIKKSNRPDLCDYQYDGAFNLAKTLHQNPLDIGNAIVEECQKNSVLTANFSQIECVKPGFVNFTLSDSYLNDLLNQMLNNPKYNIKMPPKETIILDYGGANVAKPLHVGHLRPAIFGESIKRLLTYMNQKVISDVHLGDYGLQIGQVIYGLQQENCSLENITLEKLSRIYPQMSALCKEDAEIKEKCANITKELQDGNPEYQKYFHQILEISKKDIKKIYDYLGVSFDLWLGESDAYKYIPALTTDLETENLLEESEGARVIPVALPTDKVEIPPFIYQKSNKAYLYGTTDLATIYQRKKDYNPQKIIYTTDIRQNLHFTQLFRVCQKYSLTKDIDFEFLGLGTINGTDGKPFKTRAGNTPKLEEMFTEIKEIFLNNPEHQFEYTPQDLDIIVNSIIKFADLQNNYEKSYIFDIDKFSKTTGKTGPYILYTYLRTKKILELNQTPVDNLSKTIYNVHDRNLRIKLLELENVLNYAFISRMPSVIANYLYELCVLMNAFYENNHINNLEDERKKQDWIILLNLTTKIIKDLLNILGIDIPTKM